MRRLNAGHSLAAVLVSASIIGCVPPPTVAHHPSGSQGRFIGSETIAGYGVTSAWEVLRKTGYFLTSRDDGPSGGLSIRSKRGRTSLLLSGSDVPRVLLDGTPVADLRLLRDVPATSIAWIEVFGGIEGTMMEGTNTGAGLISIVTKAGS